MTIFVSAASGQLGGAVLRALQARGAHTVAGSRSEAGSSAHIEHGAEWRRFDYDDEASLDPAFRGIDTLIVIPSFAPIEDRILQIRRTLDAAARNRVRHVIMSSFVAATIDSAFPVAPFTIYSEAILRQFDFDWTVARSGMYLEPFIEWIPELRSTGRLAYPAADGAVAYVTREDIASAIAGMVGVAGHHGETYKLTGPVARNYHEICAVISDIVGWTLRYEPATEAEFIAMAHEPGKPDYVPRALARMYRAVARGEFAETTDHVEKLAGHAPESLESYAARTLRA